MQIIMLGAPGVGKGTQSKLLSKKYLIPQISTGDILRAAIKAQSPLGLTVKALLDSGTLVSDEIVNQLVEEKLLSDECKNGFILDGYPRTTGQAETLNHFLDSHGGNRLKVIHIDVPSDELIKRLINRRKCISCGNEFNLSTDAETKSGKCPNCHSSDLLQREDDKEDTVRKRQKTFLEQTSPLIDFYREKKMLRSYDGFKEINSLFFEIDLFLFNNK
jgi:adenylate kinase